MLEALIVILDLLDSFLQFTAKISLNALGMKYFVFAKISGFSVILRRRCNKILDLGRLIFQTQSKYSNFRNNSKLSVQRGEPDIRVCLHIPLLDCFVVL